MIIADQAALITSNKSNSLNVRWLRCRGWAHNRLIFVSLIFGLLCGVNEDSVQLLPWEIALGRQTCQVRLSDSVLLIEEPSEATKLCKTMQNQSMPLYGRSWPIGWHAASWVTFRAIVFLDASDLCFLWVLHPSKTEREFSWAAKVVESIHHEWGTWRKHQETWRTCFLSNLSFIFSFWVSSFGFGKETKKPLCVLDKLTGLSCNARPSPSSLFQALIFRRSGLASTKGSPLHCPTAWW